MTGSIFITRIKLLTEWRHSAPNDNCKKNYRVGPLQRTAAKAILIEANHCNDYYANIDEKLQIGLLTTCSKHVLVDLKNIYAQNRLLVQ